MSLTRADCPCPHCGRPNDSHTGKPGTRPTPDNSWAVCWGCGEVAVFTAVLGQLGLRRLTPAEQVEADADEQLQKARAAVRAAAYPQDAAAVLWGSN